MTRRNGRAPLWTGAAAGLLASAATAPIDALLERLVGEQPKRRERRLREDSPHELAGPRAVRALTGAELSEGGEKAARIAFAAAYGLGWGLLYAALRRRFPASGRAFGLPFAVPFFLACDGLIAPLLRLTPSVHRLPWQVNAKELANHTVWTAIAEGVLRGLEARR